MAKVIQVIEVEITRGNGVEGDVMRGVTQYWSLDGTLLAENDPCPPDKPPLFSDSGADLLRSFRMQNEPA